MAEDFSSGHLRGETRMIKWSFWSVVALCRD